MLPDLGGCLWKRKGCDSIMYIISISESLDDLLIWVNVSVSEIMLIIISTLCRLGSLGYHLPTDLTYHESVLVEMSNVGYSHRVRVFPILV